MSPTPGTDRFDRDYFDHWYRQEGFGSRTRLARKVDYALAAAEYLLERPVHSVLDIGCGEGEWQPAIAARRPDATYIGVDPSTYAIERFGAERNLHHGRLDELDEVLAGLGDQAQGRFDLVVCVDVLGYATDRETKRGLAAIARRLEGVALIEVYTSTDDIVGDVEHLRRRRTATYLRWFTDAGLHRVGPHLFASDTLLPTLVSFEQPLA